MFENVRADIRHYAQFCYPGKPLWQAALRAFYAHPGSVAVVWFRLGHCAWKTRIPVVSHLLKLTYLLGLPMVRIYSGVQLLPQTRIGPGLVILHFGGVVVTRETQIGKNAVLLHNVSIITAKSRWGPTIGDNFFAGTGTTIIGDVVIEDDVACGAGSLVTQSVPRNAIVIGSPAKIKRFRDPAVDRFTENLSSPKQPAKWMTPPPGETPTRDKDSDQRRENEMQDDQREMQPKKKSDCVPLSAAAAKGSPDNATDRERD
jgi:serine O-acetyltransferase